ncbi:2-succinyl-5-enolpyruvyl-6-hydroxy-3-cyclohexene-1-carboxylic-acid synthase [Phycicoccus sonneratiae]|uniref:2-succinyl-5-enolpyruvyl-6-hydroxy-3-cyclohexene-1-carboxylate synthase n=1 Tax=Phycicoccus sonneratiae TaxID=2807628 RepID=A0ABS2CJ48_9MICO|nr:2-succinyl-5-enolpyruvyl-6-hydroxy-3-cyclohexene-1-carboxylic-acid synthase [Phycicoccus sonneraticus]MBM6399902.1 2-succinyl-5-enolpyruvyl-6-hydroxy-3-cyclohexene-1-carboxylic-acid synthase [Phycicoccus sonneraticus]
MTPSSALATVLVDELVRGGVRDVVLAPGSRSAPLAYALLDADRAGRTRLHVRVDERSAGFLALGLAKGSGRPVAVVTTSGTAVANLHPAVLEAHHAGVPLVVVSADRPHELRGTGANQTTRQPGLFGPAVRWSADLPAPDAVPTAGDGRMPSWRTAVCRALAAASGLLDGSAGPVHLDVAFRDPLAPEVGDGADLPEHLAGRPGGTPWTEVGPAAPTVAAARLEDVGRTLVVVGSVDDPQVARDAVAWARARAHPLVAEPFGPADLREAAVAHGPLLLTATDWLDAHLPERVVVVGRVTLSRAVGALLRRPGLRVEVVSEGGEWPDPSHVAAAVHGAGALRVTAEVTRTDEDDAWAGAWWTAGQEVADAVAARARPWGTGLAVAEVLAASVPHGAVLVVGSSNPVRDLDLGVAHSCAGEVVANRGLAGIDGMVSTAVGVALTRTEPVLALLGDLTFLHDANGLLAGPDEQRPDLTLVVVNDDGGGIFTTLEHGAPERAASFERVFGTPTGTDLAALCRAHGVGHTRADTADALAAEVRRRPEGLRVVEVRVDRSTHRQAHADLRDLAARTLDS